MDPLVLSRRVSACLLLTFALALWAVSPVAAALATQGRTAFDTPNPDDARWDNRFGAPWVGSFTTCALETSSGTVYVGGWGYMTAGGGDCPALAYWDGAMWSPVGGGFETTDAVSAMLLDNQGGLVVAGTFAAAGGVPASNIARWDGSQWTAMGAGLDSYVYCLAKDSHGNIYAGGAFSNSGSTPMSRVARWNGTSWSALGTGIAGLTVSALAVDGASRLYAGGSFEAAGGVPATNVARWNGTSWSALNGPPENPGVSGYVRAMAIDHDGGLFIAGDIGVAGSLQVHEIARWSGGTWSSLGILPYDFNPGEGILSLVIDQAGLLVAGGSFSSIRGVPISRLARWNGTSWSSLGRHELSSGSVSSVTLGHHNDLIVAGGVQSVAGSAAGVARWDGSDWHGYGWGLSGIALAMARDDSGHIYVGGGFSSVADSATSHFGRWDGAGWGHVGDDMGADDFVHALVCDHSGNVYAAGLFSTVGGVPAERVARFDGTRWWPLGDGLFGDVRALARDSHGTLFSGGGFSDVTSTGQSLNNIAQWNGSEWINVGGGIEGMVRSMVADGAGNLYVGGLFWQAGGVEMSCVARWNGSTWSPLGSGIAGIVYALALAPDGTLYAAGVFDQAGTSAVSNVVRWNGSTWSALGAGLDGEVDALAVDASGNLYAGGYFAHAGGVAAEKIAKWNGSSWFSLGSGIGSFGSHVSTLAFDSQGNLLVGGYFSVAGGKLATSISLWHASAVLAVDEPLVGSMSVAIKAASPYPVPAAGRVQLNFALPQAGPSRVDVLEVTGRRVRTLQNGPLSEGPHTIVWDGCDERGVRLASGVYFMRMSQGSAVAMRRVVLVH
ncbi:MAG: hypothetical protein IT348_01235 [Candidatus Eisenbacteria bacterium]|nr:hypothetical protein [Candidatus Eisenbacteria bacterium]